MHYWAFLVAPLLTPLAFGASIARRASSSDAPPAESNATTGGQSPAPDLQPCGANETVKTCAENVAKTWQIPVSSQGEPQRLNVSLTAGSVSGYITPLVYIEASNCSLSDAKIVWQDQNIYCGISMCQDTFTFTTTSTVTDTYGFSASITLTDTVEASALFAKFTTSISVTAGTSFSRSTSVATTKTTTQMFSMANGQQCTPTTIQYSVQCHTKIKMANTATQWAWQPNDPAKAGPTITEYSCNDLNTLTGEPGGNNEFAEFCTALADEGQVAVIDVGLPGFDAGPWSMEGCMWET